MPDFDLCPQGDEPGDPGFEGDDPADPRTDTTLGSLAMCEAIQMVYRARVQLHMATYEVRSTSLQWIDRKGVIHEPKDMSSGYIRNCLRIMEHRGETNAAIYVEFKRILKARKDYWQMARDLTTVIRDVVEKLQAAGPEQADAIVQPLREIGVVARMNEGMQEQMDNTPMGQEIQLYWYAGQILNIVEKKSWFAMNSVLNCVDKFAPFTG